MLYKIEKIKIKEMNKKKLIIVGIIIFSFIVLIIFVGTKYLHNEKLESDKGSIEISGIHSIKGKKLLNKKYLEFYQVIQPEVKKEKIDHKKLFSTAIQQELDKRDKWELMRQEYAVDVENTYKKDGKKYAFLTFDDGPSKAVTPEILKVLDKYNVKATFFIVGSFVEENRELLIKEYENGHAIGNHSYTHDYNKLYANVDNFKEEVDKTNKVFKHILGENFKTRLFRFPGGSFERYKNPFKDYLISNGYRYIDWNALNGDAEGGEGSVDALVQRVKSTVYGNEHVVILMHDAPAKKNTAKALPRVIEYLKEQGYEFKILK
jgi:peptidoglycan/xylan/chitin deacetylase (PgdA/CDA1 family)